MGAEKQPHKKASHLDGLLWAKALQMMDEHAVLNAELQKYILEHSPAICPPLLRGIRLV